MARNLFDVELGYKISGENGVELVRQLAGTGIPGGDTSFQDDAPIGSLYQKTDGAGGLYKKIANAGSTADWEEVGNVSIDQLSWRSDKVVVATVDTLAAGTVDPATFSDNESGIDGSTFVVGTYIIGDTDGSPALFEITAAAANSVTIVAASQAIADNDTFMVQNYLPDSPATQENQAIFHVPVAGSAGIKIADVDFAFASGIDIAAGYAAASGDVAAGDSVQEAIQKLDGVNDAQDTLLGTAQGATDLGTFTGDIISDNTVVTTALQELETELVDTRDNVDDLILLSGVAENEQDLGSFTGTTIADDSTIKEALQDLELAVEATQATGEATGVTAVTTVDSVLVDNYEMVEWEVVSYEDATPANKKFQKVTALHDGTASADATEVDDSVHTKLKVGSPYNISYTVDLDGTGAAQVMRLQVASTTAGVTVKFRRNGVLV